MTKPCFNARYGVDPTTSPPGAGVACQRCFNARYGVDPTTPQSLQDLGLLRLLFGPSEGRFITEYPSDWRERFHAYARSLGDLQAHRAVEVLQQLKHALLAEGEAPSWDSARSWAENASPLKAELDWMDLLGPPGSPAPVKVFQKLLDEAEPLPPSRGALIWMTADAYAKAARPLMLTSPKIILVDKYFDPRKPDRAEVLVALLRVALEGGKVNYLEVCNNYKFPEEHKNAIDDCLRKVDAKDRIKTEVKSIQRGGKNKGISVHARYLLGNHGGPHFDHGFQIHSPEKPTRNDVQWLERSKWEDLWAHYG